MKSRVVLTVLICCLLSIFGLRLAALNSGSREIAAPSDPVFRSGDRTGAFSWYRTIRCAYYESGGQTILDSWFQIYNTSPTSSITVDLIYAFENEGLDGPAYPYDGLQGVTIPPLGSRGFWIGDVGIPPWTDEDGRGPFTVAVTGNGPGEAARLTGTITTFNAGVPVGVRAIEQF